MTSYLFNCHLTTDKNARKYRHMSIIPFSVRAYASIHYEGRRLKSFIRKDHIYIKLFNSAIPNTSSATPGRYRSCFFDENQFEQAFHWMKVPLDQSLLVQLCSVNGQKSLDNCLLGQTSLRQLFQHA